MANTPNRGYPKPVDSREIAEDVTTLQQATDMIDGDMASAFAQIAGKAPAGHTHPMTDVEGLTIALGSKAAANHTHSLDDLTDVDGAAAATTGQIPYKTPAGIAFGDPGTIMGAHGHTIEQVTGLQTALDSKLDDSQLDTNTGLAANSDTKIATQKATKSYVDAAIAALRNGVSAAYDTLAELAGAITALGTASTRNIATAAEFSAGTANRALGASEVWAAAPSQALAFGATMTPDFSKLNHSVTLTGNAALGNPTNAKPGQSGYVSIYQDATGSRTLSFGANWKFAGGLVPTLSTAANAWDKLYYSVEATDRIHAHLVKDIR